MTVANGAAITAFDSRWRIRDDWGISDHNLIEIMITCPQRTRETVDVLRWRTRDVIWDLYRYRLREALSSVPIDDFRRLTIDDQVDKIVRTASSVNDVLLGRATYAKPKRVKWWTPELETMHVRHLRRRFQRGRRV